MRTFIQKCFSAVECHKDYVENNADYTYGHDILLEDDSVYSKGTWETAIENACDEDLTEGELDYIKEQIISMPDFYCEVKTYIQGFPHAPDDNIVASFGIGEVEIYLGEINSPFVDGIVSYLNKHCPNDAYYTVSNGILYAYLDYSYSYVGYALKPENVIIALEQYREENNVR